MPRIAIAGFQHETNTFVPNKATFHDFQIADSWPEMLFGANVISGTRGMNLPIAGFAKAATNAGFDLAPILWTAAEPSAHVTNDAFERITGMILEGLAKAGPVDGIYLDLHGAMVTESYEDGEGELLRRVREVAGPDLPIAISLDLHANVTPEMVELADMICIYRTYPHLDMAETGARCVPLMVDLIKGTRFAKAFRQAPFLIPLHAQFTGADPCRAVYGALDSVDGPADVALGFTASDIWHCGPSVVAYAATQAQADTVADGLMARIESAEADFDTTLLSPEQAVRQAMARTDPRPIVIADVQDNAGAGGTADTTGLLAAMVSEAAKGAILGLLCDADMAAMAHQAGVGAEISGDLGGKSGMPGQVPFTGSFRVEALSDGQCTYTGEMYGGGIAVLGACAVLRVVGTDVRVVVSSNRSQCLDRAIFEHIGVDLMAARIIGVKSTVHFRADFDPISAQTLACAAPGGFVCDLTQVHYQNLRPRMRLGPVGPAFKPVENG